MPTRNKKLCFVLMPFKDDLKVVYWKAIRPACEKADFASLRVDELKGAFNINRKIIEHIIRSEAIVADLTGWNPNVFYEMGVAHALDNKTIMIIQKQDKLPFDVSTYRCILYDQTEAGLTSLCDEVRESLLSIEEWRNHPTNPVQDFKPHEVFVLKSEVAQLFRQLQEKEERLHAAAPQAELEKLQRQVQKLERELRSQEQLARQGASLQKELAGKQAENDKLRGELANLCALSKSVNSPMQTPLSSPLRSQLLTDLSFEAAQEMITQKDYFDSLWNAKGKGIQHQFETSEHEGQKLVIDCATDLIWQQSGSLSSMTYTEAEKFVHDLTTQRFASYKDWRLPTLEEAMSLMAPEQREGLCIDPIFDRTQRWIWTADKANAEATWVVLFDYGRCDHFHVYVDVYVRAVRDRLPSI
ncbi:MAG: DUF1566 domain-containing protein [bacterium]